MIDKSSVMNFKKVKKRDFNINCKMLTSLGAEYYDGLQNIDSLALQVKQTLAKSKTLWKETDDEKLYRMIKRCLIDELYKVEERKQVRRTQEEIARREQERREAEQENQEMLNQKAQQSPGKGVNFGGSPWKKGGSPTKLALDQQSNMQSEADDTKSFMTGMMSKSNTN